LTVQGSLLKMINTHSSSTPNSTDIHCYCENWPVFDN